MNMISLTYIAMGNWLFSCKDKIYLEFIFVNILGGVCQVMLNKTFAKLRLGRSAVIIFGFILHLTAFSLIYVNLPNNASYGETADPAIIQSRYKL